MPTFSAAELIAGFALGILSALFFALYMVPQKATRADLTTYLFTMGVGVLCTALIPYLIVGAPNQSTLLQKGAGVLCGVIWGLGTLSFAASITSIGMALSTPIKNTTGVLGTLVGLVIFQEWKTTNPWLGTAGSIMIVAAAIIIGLTGDRSIPTKRTATGVGFALLAAVCYASYLYPLKSIVGAIGYWEFTPWMALGIVITASVAVLVRRGGVRALLSYPRRSYGLFMLGGAAWTVALYSLAASMEMVDLSVAWSLAQLNTIPAVIIGGIMFREVNMALHRRTLYLGLLVATIGTLLLGWAKS